MKKTVHITCAPGFVLHVLNNISTLISSESLFSQQIGFDVLKHTGCSHSIKYLLK